MDVYEILKGWSAHGRAQAFKVCQPYLPRGGSRAGQKSHRGVPFFRNQIFDVFLKEGGGGALMHVFVWEHIVNLYYRTT